MTMTDSASPDRPPLLFVHGSNTDGRIWDEHRDIVGSRYGVIARTQRYFGAPPWPDDGRNFSIETHAADLADFINSSGLAPVTVVGWSYGAAVCLAMTLQHPDLVNRLFVYEPALATFVSDPAAAKNAMDDRIAMSKAAKEEANRGNFASAVQLFMNGVNDDGGAFESLTPRIQQIMFENARMLSLLFAATPPKITCVDMQRISIPVTVAVGEESRPFYKICAQWAAQCMPNARLVTIPNARHLWPVQNPREFTDAVLGAIA
jgi:pimeloyl-ACP methyl ester carboxylesterase